MQRMKQLAMGAFSVALATTGLAHAGDTPQDPAKAQGGRNSQPAPHTGAAAPSDTTTNRSSSAGQGSSASQGAGTSQGSSASQGAAMSQGSAMSATSDTRRAQMEQAQRELATRGLYQGAIDGVAGPQTMAALRQFQEQQGLTPSGRMDEATRQALGIQLDRQPVAGAQTTSGPELERPVGREGGTAGISGNMPMRSQVQLDRLNQEQLRMLQTRLSELGFYQGSVDGVLGENTRSGLRQFFQTQAELAARGVITDATISLFGFSPQGLNPPTGNTATGNLQTGNPQSGATQPGNMQPGRMQPGNMQPGNMQGGSVQGGNIQGGSAQPGNTPMGTNPARGSETRGGQPRGSMSPSNGPGTAPSGGTPSPQTNPSPGIR